MSLLKHVLCSFVIIKLFIIVYMYLVAQYNAQYNVLESYLTCVIFIGLKKKLISDSWQTVCLSDNKIKIIILNQTIDILLVD